MVTTKAVPMANVVDRWVIIDVDTGEVLDDAQGYGYRSPQKAHAAYNYKNRTPKQKARSRKNKQVNKQFLEKHKKLSENWGYICFDMLKNGEEPEYSDFKRCMEEWYPDFDGNTYSLYKYVMSH